MKTYIELELAIIVFCGSGVSGYPAAAAGMLQSGSSMIQSGSPMLSQSYASLGTTQLTMAGQAPSATTALSTVQKLDVPTPASRVVEIPPKPDSIDIPEDKDEYIKVCRLVFI